PRRARGGAGLVRTRRTPDAGRVPGADRALAAVPHGRDLVPVAEPRRVAEGGRGRPPPWRDSAPTRARPGGGVTVNFDLILKGGWVIDGTGGPPFQADLGVRDTKVAAVGRLDGAQAPKVLDVTDRYVVPGFIDAHVHGDAVLLTDPVHLPALK